ncbi:nuclear transport factor 2 family protein [Salinimicrobium sp. TH3]|uniref:nuclear transport factor 2 family protein n=1 Tax=Salinimicrobium sp. TH3 TaxID=2997342 RepID=UPI002272574D|nr:nuclear transport factor 2 family protein [Salinimicrobium sp. TH3]MCY2688258.1 nuclear transport factor 2 family protein [Salinimicrobium sp. TH3]
MQHPNEKIILEFFQAFQKGNAKAMNACYHKNVVFYDPVFGHIKGDRVRAMWYMLLEKSGGELNISFSEIQANDYNGSARWTASYYYGPSRRRVVNEVVGTFYIQNGKILQHTNHFDLWNWSRQALGFKGFLMGWTKSMKLEIQQESSKMLSRYIHKMRSLEEDDI